MIEQQPLKAVITVTEMAQMCGLSRARFYQLVGEGIFPQPSRNEQTQRPYYDQGQQQRCLMVRRTNRGVNGKVTIFYGLHPKGASTASKPSASKRNLRGKNIGKKDQRITALHYGLTQLGVAGASDFDIQRALTEVFPDGCDHIESSDLLRAVFNRLTTNKQ